jgi:2-oxoglutarate ferredoxin oxidoreductase subunit delta
MAKLVLDSEYCKGCLLCTTVCPKGLLKKGETFNSFGYYAVTIIDEDGCNGCTLCAEICPDIAIMVWK